MCRMVLFCYRSYYCEIRDLEKCIEYIKKAIMRSKLCSSAKEEMIFIVRDYGYALSCGDVYLVSCNRSSVLCNVPVCYVDIDFILMNLQAIGARLGYNRVAVYCSLNVDKCALKSIIIENDEAVVRFD